jgi:hypothetical protein
VTFHEFVIIKDQVRKKVRETCDFNIGLQDSDQSLFPLSTFLLHYVALQPFLQDLGVMV